MIGLSAVAYAILAIRVSRSGPLHADSIISILLFLIAALLAGAAFSYGASSASLYGIGRILTFFAGSFIPVAFYAIYREYTVGRPNTTIMVALCIVPVLTCILALTNSMHNLIWIATDTPGGLVHSSASDHIWYKSVYLPFTYGLVLLYAVIALTARLPTIAPLHRKTILLLLTCASLPFAASVANNVLGIGAPEFPFTAATLSLVWPCFAYASLKMRVHEFSPLAYQTLFDHVRDPIFVVDNRTTNYLRQSRSAELAAGQGKRTSGSQTLERISGGKGGCLSRRENST